MVLGYDSGFGLKTIVIQEIAGRIEETPAKCKEEMVRSTEAPVWATLQARAEYTVPPVPEPASIGDMRRSKNDGGSSQKFTCFIWGNVTSGAPVISGPSLFSSPAIIMGTTVENIITSAGTVITTLQIWASPSSAPG